MHNIIIFYLGYLSFDIHKSQDKRGRGRSILFPLYHFQPLHQDLEISWRITAGSSPLDIASNQTGTWKPLVSKRKLLTTKVHALIIRKQI